MNDKATQQNADDGQATDPQADTNGPIAEGAMTGEQANTQQQRDTSQEPAPPPEAAPPSGPALQGYDRASQQPREEPFRLELGAKVYLFERAVDDASNVLDGYQKPKLGKVVKFTEDDHHIDVETGGETEPKIISHDVAYRTERDEGANFWSETDKE